MPPIKFLTAKLKGPVLAKTGAELLTTEIKGGQPQQKVRAEFAALIKERLAHPGKGTVALLFLRLLNRLENRGKGAARGKLTSSTWNAGFSIYQ